MIFISFNNKKIVLLHNKLKMVRNYKKKHARKMWKVDDMVKAIEDIIQKETLRQHLKRNIHGKICNPIGRLAV